MCFKNTGNFYCYYADISDDGGRDFFQNDGNTLHLDTTALLLLVMGVTNCVKETCFE
jgi:hypothetical protein